MIIIPKELEQIKSHHTYCHKSKTSTWTGLNKAGKVQGGEMDKLRNNLPNSNWSWLLHTVEANLHKLPTKQKDEWDKALLNLLRCCDIDINPKNAVYVQGEFSDYITNKNRDYRQLQKALWQYLMAGCESLEFIHYDYEPKQDSLFEW